MPKQSTTLSPTKDSPQVMELTTSTTNSMPCKPLAVIDCGNSGLKIHAEIDGKLSMSVARSIGRAGIQTHEGDKRANLADVAADYKAQGYEVIGLVPDGLSVRGIRTYREALVVLDQRAHIPNLSAAKCLIDLGGGTTLVAGLMPDGRAANIPHSYGDAGVLRILASIIGLDGFGCQRPGGLAPLSPAQLGMMLAKGAMIDGGGRLVLGGLVIDGWAARWAPKMSKAIEAHLASVIGVIERSAPRLGFADFSPAEITIIGGGAALLDHLAPYSAGGDALAIRRYQPGVQAPHLNAYAAYKAAGGKLPIPHAV
jgi:hypothetical protein